MTSLNHPTWLADRPSSVALGELAIAAGLVGESLALNFRDFPAMISCELWRYFTEGVGLGQVLRVCTRKDIKDLGEMVAGLRIVIVQTDSLCREVSWAIQLADASQPRIAIVLVIALMGNYYVVGMGLAMLWTAAIFAFFGGIVMIVRAFQQRSA